MISLAKWCPMCQRQRLAKAVIELAPGVWMCDECLAGLEKRAGSLRSIPAGCEECHGEFPLSGNDKVVVNMIIADGRYHAFCAACADKWVLRRKDMFQETRHMRDVEARQ
jgi:hypothetical protein